MFVMRYLISSEERYYPLLTDVSEIICPAETHVGGLEKGSLLDCKIGRYEKIRIFLAKRDGPLVRMNMPVNKMSGSEKVIVGLKSR